MTMMIDEQSKNS